MSSRPSIANAFADLKPTIVRTPTRTQVTPAAEARLLDTNPTYPQETGRATGSVKDRIDSHPSVSAPKTAVAALPGHTLLTKKKKDILVPVTFRMPQNLKVKLESAAKSHEINQTDLINEAIELNLQRYL